MAHGTELRAIELLRAVDVPRGKNRDEHAIDEAARGRKIEDGVVARAREVEHLATWSHRLHGDDGRVGFQWHWLAYDEERRALELFAHGIRVADDELERTPPGCTERADRHFPVPLDKSDPAWPFSSRAHQPVATFRRKWREPGFGERCRDDALVPDLVS